MSLIVINPDNIEPDLMPDGNLIYSKEICERLPEFFKVLAIGCFILGVITVSCVKKNPDYVINAEVVQSDQLTVKEGLKTPSFYLLILMDALSIMPVVYVGTVFKAMGLQLGQIDDFTLTVVGSVGAIVNGCSRLIIGNLQDKFGFSTIYRGILVVELVFCALVTTVVHINAWLYAFWICLGFVCLGAHFVMFPIVMTKKFGLRSGPQLSSFVYSSRGLSALAGATLASKLADAFDEKSYSVMFYLSCLLIIISASLNIFCLEEKEIRKVIPDVEMPLLGHRNLVDDEKKEVGTYTGIESNLSLADLSTTNDHDDNFSNSSHERLNVQ